MAESTKTMFLSRGGYTRPVFTRLASPALLAVLISLAPLLLAGAGESKVRRGDTWLGTWWLDFDDGYGGSLEITRDGEKHEAKLLWRVGSARSVKIESINDRELVLQRSRRVANSKFVATLVDGELRIQLSDSDEFAIGGRCAPMPPQPDLASVRFADPIVLFNGRDLSGWQLQPTSALNGWQVEGGELINETPKTDFSGYGEYGNLRTESVFGDGKLSIEFNVGKKGNSGIYVRGLYEAQVVDRDSTMQGISGPGAIFGRVKPSHNAGLPGGEWQTYEITLIDRHLTVELNGQVVIENEPVSGSTGGALFGDVSRKGPVYLQGDHTSVRYRNIQFRSRVDP